jgi:LPXTG-motif cell wall-anchored protein
MIGIVPSTGGDAIKIVIGGLIALAVVGYVAWQWKKFD